MATVSTSLEFFRVIATRADGTEHIPLAAGHEHRATRLVERLIADGETAEMVRLDIPAHALAGPREPALATTYFSRVKERRGRRILDGVYGSPVEAELFEGPEETIVEECQFRPLPSPARFRVMDCEWEPSFDWSMPEVEMYAHLWASRDQYPKRPASLVDVPPEADVSIELYGMRRLMTREAAFAEVARRNREWLERILLGDHDIDADSQKDALLWLVVVEYGRAVQSPYVHTQLLVGRVGEEVRHIQHPVRVAIPTADELAQYAMPDELVAAWEGGAK